MSGLTHVAFIIGLLSKLVHCQIGTSYQQNHPNHVLSNMMQNTDPIMAPSIATPQTGKTSIQPQQNLIYRVLSRSWLMGKTFLISSRSIRFLA